MRDNQDIKDQLKKIKNLISESNPIVKNHYSEIKKKYLIKEDIEQDPTVQKRYNVPKSVEDEIQDDKKNDAEQSYRISGGVISIHGDTKKDTDLTGDDKIAFQETMDEFVSEVSDLVNFDQLNVYQDKVDWSGKIVDYDIDFYFTIGENNGIYISGEMMKLDDNLLQVIDKLQKYYEKFKSKWARILASRKKTKPDTNEQ
jgi:hypothetical protein